jgi:hypothetical protein
MDSGSLSLRINVRVVELTTLPHLASTLKKDISIQGVS